MPGDNDDEVAARGILYLLIFQQLGQLVRWSWGYHVLLAPPEKFEGEDEHANDQIEQGRGRYRDEADTDDEEDLLGASASEDDERYGGSSDTAAGSPSAGTPSDGHRVARKAGGSSPHTESDFESGVATPVTHYQYTSSVSSKKSSRGPKHPDSAPGLLPTPANGNVLPGDGSNGNITSFPSIRLPSPGTGDGHMVAPKRWVSHLKSWLRETITSLSSKASKGMATVFGSLPLPVQRALSAFRRGSIRFLHGLWDFMNPPLWAMLAAIVVASIPSLQRLFFTEGTFLQNSVTRAVSQSGGVAIPLILVVLGANLANNTVASEGRPSVEKDKLETRLLIASIVSRMVLPFIIMAPMLALAAKYVPISILDDPIFVIVCFLLTGAPSALQLAQICQINGVYENVMARLLFQSYVIW